MPHDETTSNADKTKLLFAWSEERRDAIAPDVADMDMARDDDDDDDEDGDEDGKAANCDCDPLKRPNTGV